MGFLGDILGTIGDVGKFASPLLALTGVGAPIAAGIGAGAGLLGKLNDEDQSLGSILGAGATGGITGGLAGLGGEALGKSATAAGEGASRLGQLGNLIQADPMKAAQLGGAGLSAIQGSRQQAKINKLIEEELERQREENARRLPFQDMLQEQLNTSLGAIGQRPDLSGLFANSQNPFATAGGVPGLGALPGVQPTRGTVPSYDGRP